MRRTTRAALLGCVGAVALVVAGQALAAYTPKLVVQMGDAGTTIKLAIPSTDDPTAKLTFYAPAGTGANLSATAGSTIGTLDAKASAAALGGATLPLTGTVQARAADGTYLSSGQPRPLALASMACTGTTAHSAWWVLVLTAAGQTLEVPLFVDPSPAGLPFSPLLAYQLVVCLPPSDIPESAGGAAFGAKVFEANFTVKGVFSPTTSGDNVWRLLGTAYNPGKGTPNAAGTVEAQSFVETGNVALATPGRTLTRLAATFRAAGTVRITGLPDTTATVSLARGTSATKLSIFAHPAVSSDGTFASRFAIRRVARRAQSFYVQATATAPQRDLAATACHATFGLPCIGATASGFVDVSSVRKVTVPAAPPRKKKK
jgi:hypothetical protein